MLKTNKNKRSCRGIFLIAHLFAVVSVHAQVLTYCEIERMIDSASAQMTQVGEALYELGDSELGPNDRLSIVEQLAPSFAEDATIRTDLDPNVDRPGTLRQTTRLDSYEEYMMSLGIFYKSFQIQFIDAELSYLNFGSRISPPQIRYHFERAFQGTDQRNATYVDTLAREAAFRFDEGGDTPRIVSIGEPITPAASRLESQDRLQTILLECAEEESELRRLRRENQAQVLSQEQELADIKQQQVASQSAASEERARLERQRVEKEAQLNETIRTGEERRQQEIVRIATRMNRRRLIAPALSFNVQAFMLSNESLSEETGAALAAIGIGADFGFVKAGFASMPYNARFESPTPLPEVGFPDADQDLLKDEMTMVIGNVVVGYPFTFGEQFSFFAGVGGNYTWYQFLDSADDSAEYKATALSPMLDFSLRWLDTRRGFGVNLFASRTINATHGDLVMLGVSAEVKLSIPR